MHAIAAIGQVRGLPAHVFLVHAVVVLVPLSAGLLVLAAWWPAARVRLGPFLPLLAAGCLVLVPLTTNAGAWLQQRVGPDPLVQRHAALGEQLLPWVAALLLLAVAVWQLGRRQDAAAGQREPVSAGSAAGSSLAGSAVTAGRDEGRVGGGRGEGSRVVGSPVRSERDDGAARVRPLLALAVAVAATAVAVGSVVQVVRIGESGAEAVWQGVTTAGG